MSRAREIQRWLLTFLLAAFLLGSALADPQSPKVRFVDVKAGKEKVEVNVKADKPVQYRAFQVMDPAPALVFEIYPAVLWGKKQTRPVGVADIRSVRVAQFSSDPDVVRVVVDLEQKVKYTTTQSRDQHELRIALGSQADHQAAKAPVAVAATEEQPVWSNIKIEQKVIKGPSQSAYAVYPKAKPSTGADESLQSKLNQIFVARVSKKKKMVKKVAKPELVSFNWRNADLTDVIRQLTDRLGLNVIIDTSVKGTVTLDLKNVPASQALGMILAINGYASRQIGNILVVGPPDKLDKLPTTPVAVGPQAIQVIPLENAKASDLRDTVMREFPEVRVEVDSRTNSLLVKGPVASIRKVKALVAELDKPAMVAGAPPQKEVIQLNYAQVKDVLSQVKPLLPGDAVLIADERLNSIIVIGSQYTIDTLKSFISTVDVPVPQVMLEMTVVSINETANRDLGLEWPGGATSNFSEVAHGEVPALPPAGGAPVTANTLNLNNIGFHTFVRDNISLRAQLHWLVQQNKAKVLGAPRVATVNNKEANIQLGDRVPIVYFDPRAGLYQVQYIDVGVILRVTPSISPDGNITVHVNPQVSEVTGFVQNFPQLSTRQADTTVRVRNGETIVLGGLLRERNTDALTKIPLLGDIPIIGEFFRHRVTVHEKTDLVISITPTLMASK